MHKKAEEHSSPKDWVALVLTVALSTAVNVLVVGITYAAVTGKLPDDGMLISENSTQIITGTFSGIIGVIGSYLGFKAGSQTNGSSKESQTNGESGKGNQETDSGESSRT